MPTAPAALSPAPPGQQRRPREAPAPQPVPARSCAGRSLPSTSRGICAATGRTAASSSSDQSRRADVEPQRARGVGHLVDEFAAELQRSHSLGQQHRRSHALEDGRLVLAHPQELGRGEARHGEVAGDGTQARRTRRRARRICGALRLSFQRMHGRSTSPWRVEQVAPCIWPERPIRDRIGERRPLRGAQPVKHSRRSPATKPADPARTSQGAADRATSGALGDSDDAVVVEQHGLDRGGAEVDAERDHGRLSRR